VGKEILWFHSIIWPAILMALDLPTPKCIYAHSFWISEGKKMSKSLGNFIDLELIEAYLNRYGMDAWRYFLATQGPLGTADADFAEEKFFDTYNAHLVNTVGNCTSRVTAMIEKYFEGELPSECVDGDRLEMGGVDWPAKCEDAVKRYQSSMEQFEVTQSVEAGMELIREVDLFINDTAPFKLAKDESKAPELGAILYQCLEVLRIASLILQPVIPGKMEAFHKAIGMEQQPDQTFALLMQWGGLKAGTRIHKVALFPRVETERIKQAN
jgi:methionyl-tRNA synthetase